MNYDYFISYNEQYSKVRYHIAYSQRDRAPLLVHTLFTSDIIKMLLHKGIDINYRSDSWYEQSLLSYILGFNYVYDEYCNCAKSLSLYNSVKTLIDAGADVNLQDEKILNYSPLMYAIASDCVRVDIIKLLVDAGSNVNTKSFKNKSPLINVLSDCILDNVDTKNVVKILLHNGAEVNIVDYATILPGCNIDIDSIYTLLKYC